jgi:hypothetical protein
MSCLDSSQCSGINPDSRVESEVEFIEIETRQVAIELKVSCNAHSLAWTRLQ